MALGLPGSVRDPISVKQEEGRREGSAVKSRVVVEGLSLVLSGSQPSITPVPGDPAGILCFYMDAHTCSHALIPCTHRNKISQCLTV